MSFSAMPLYEYFCDDCAESFEALVSLSASEQGVYSCPTCGEVSRRILSAVNFAEGRTRHQPAGRAPDGKPDVTSLTLPPAARLCWMDGPSAARLAAYKAGRGAEYDDTVAARKELASQRGETGVVNGGQTTTSHSPLSDPAVLANRGKAAAKEKVVESASIAKSSTAKQG